MRVADHFSPDLRQADYFAQAYGLPQVDQQVKLVFVGRLTLDKGWDFTFKAMQAVLNRVDPAQVALIVAGDGSMEEEIAHVLQRLTPHVHLSGRIAPEQILCFSRIVIFTSPRPKKRPGD